MTTPTVPDHLLPECGDTCCPGVDVFTANQNHSRDCEADATPDCKVWLDSRYHQHLRGTPTDPDAWVCGPCRLDLGLPAEAVTA